MKSNFGTESAFWATLGDFLVRSELYSRENKERRLSFQRPINKSLTPARKYWFYPGKIIIKNSYRIRRLFTGRSGNLKPEVRVVEILERLINVIT